MSKLEWLIAFRYLRERRRDGFISVVAWFSLIGVMLGVATLIIVLSVMNGFRTELFSRVIGINGHIIVQHRFGDPLPYDEDLITQLKHMDGIRFAGPLIESQALAISQSGNATGVMVRGLEAETINQRPMLKDNIDGNGLSFFTDNEGLLLGRRLLNRLRPSFDGDGLRTLTLLSPKMQNTVFGSVPKANQFQVAGSFFFEMYEYDDNVIFMPLSKAQNFFDMDGQISRIELISNDPQNAQSLAKEINQTLPPEMTAIAWQQINGSFFNALEVERNVMFLILTLIILVAAFNIVSSQIMLVKDKARGIAILRSMGADKYMILRIFTLTGSAVGIIGASFGALLGLLFSYNIEAIRNFIETVFDTELFQAEIYFLSQLPSEVNLSEVALVIIMALTASLLAAIYPAFRAARLDPVEILRYG